MNDSAAQGQPTCAYCGWLGWTVEKYGRVTHKQACPHRTDPWHQGDPTAAQGREIRDEEGRPITMGEQIPMYCAACGKPWRFDPITTTWAKPYTCPCGGTKAVGTVTFHG